jgi:hypothetical protein
MTPAMPRPPTPFAIDGGDGRARGDDGDGPDEPDEPDEGSDRRLATRVLVDLEVDCESDENYLFALITDISATGIFIRTNAPQPAGTRLNRRFATPKLQVRGPAAAGAPRVRAALFPDRTAADRVSAVANDAQALPLTDGAALHDGADRFALEGVVAWVNPLRPGQVDNLHPGMGVRFVELRDADRRRLERLITRMAYLPE